MKFPFKDPCAEQKTGDDPHCLLRVIAAMAQAGVGAGIMSGIHAACLRGAELGDQLGQD